MFARAKNILYLCTWIVYSAILPFIMSTAALNNIWNQILTLGMTDANWDWLQERITEQRQTNQVAKDMDGNVVFPCTFTEEEWEEELLASEREGDATEEETKQFYEKWGIAM